jgi:hypothetical protein
MARLPRNSTVSTLAHLLLLRCLPDAGCCSPGAMVALGGVCSLSACLKGEDPCSRKSRSPVCSLWCLLCRSPPVQLRRTRHLPPLSGQRARCPKGFAASRGASLSRTPPLRASSVGALRVGWARLKTNRSEIRFLRPHRADTGRTVTYCSWAIRGGTRQLLCGTFAFGVTRQHVNQGPSNLVIRTTEDPERFRVFPNRRALHTSRSKISRRRASRLDPDPGYPLKGQQRESVSLRTFDGTRRFPKIVPDTPTARSIKRTANQTLLL